jgi:hypothetical protein
MRRGDRALLRIGSRVGNRPDNMSKSNCDTLMPGSRRHSLGSRRHSLGSRRHSPGSRRHSPGVRAVIPRGFAPSFPGGSRRHFPGSRRHCPGVYTPGYALPAPPRAGAWFFWTRSIETRGFHPGLCAFTHLRWVLDRANLWVTLCCVRPGSSIRIFAWLGPIPCNPIQPAVGGRQRIARGVNPGAVRVSDDETEVREGGLEPPIPVGNQILNLARLPIPPLSLCPSILVVSAQLLKPRNPHLQAHTRQGLRRSGAAVDTTGIDSQNCLPSATSFFSSRLDPFSPLIPQGSPWLPATTQHVS